MEIKNEKLLNEMKESDESISNITDISELEEIRVSLFGKNGKVNILRREIVNVPNEEKKNFGMQVNYLKELLEKRFEEKKSFLEEEELNRKIKNEKIDVTFPGKFVRKGAVHPLTKVLRDLSEIFKTYGFSIAEGPEVEMNEYCFDRLNIPKNHPARDEADTFYTKDEHCLRTHTSSVQVRTMLSQKPPIKIIAPGRVYRKDDFDATHSPVFHQIEGLYVSEDVSFADLRSLLINVLKDYFGEHISVSFQPSFFPFTEPSAEVYISCFECGGKDSDNCSVCKGAGNIEVLGCGMVHPQVFEKCEIDSGKFKGYAFGIGIERIAMIKYQVNDIRYFYENDKRFLRNFE